MCLLLVARDDLRFYRDRSADHLDHLVRIELERLFRCHESEILRIADEPMLDDLAETRYELTRGQGFQSVHVDHDRCGLSERAHQVLDRIEVDAGLATHRRVDLGDGGRWPLNEIDAAHVGRRGKAADIAYHSAPHVYEDRLPIRARGVEHTPDLSDSVDILVIFTGSKGISRSFERQSCGKSVQKLSRDIPIRHNHRLRIAHTIDEGSRVLQDIPPDKHRILFLVRAWYLNGDALHAISLRGRPRQAGRRGLWRRRRRPW